VKSQKWGFTVFIVTRKPAVVWEEVEVKPVRKKSSQCGILRGTCQSLKTHQEDLSMKKVAIENNSSAQMKWDCKYHIAFAPKYL